jgi:hypothetical protein
MPNAQISTLWSYFSLYISGACGVGWAWCTPWNGQHQLGTHAVQANGVYGRRGRQ